MVKRTSRKQIDEQQAKYSALMEFRRTPRIVGVQFTHDDIPPPLALRVSHNEEPHEIHMCRDQAQLESVKAWQRNLSLWNFLDGFRQHVLRPSNWGVSREKLDDFTPDYFDSYAPEDRGDLGVELLPV